VVDGGGLENRCTRKGIGGSNPSPSATPSLRSVVAGGRGLQARGVSPAARRQRARIPSVTARVAVARSWPEGAGFRRAASRLRLPAAGTNPVGHRTRRCRSVVTGGRGLQARGVSPAARRQRARIPSVMQWASARSTDPVGHRTRRCCSVVAGGRRRQTRSLSLRHFFFAEGAAVEPPARRQAAICPTPWTPLLLLARPRGSG
jgi:hypothetical protein